MLFAHLFAVNREEKACIFHQYQIYGWMQVILLSELSG